MHCALILGLMIAFTGQTFGSEASPGNWEPFANARQQIAEHIWAILDLPLLAAAFLPSIVFAAPPTPAEVATFVQANADAENPGVLDANGERLPPAFVTHVDDCAYADIREFMLRTIAASIMALFEVLGYPMVDVQVALSLAKFLGHYNHIRKVLGYLINSRTMTVDILPNKREQIVAELARWMTMKSFTLREAAVLVGSLEHISRYNLWGRVWFFALRNAIRHMTEQCRRKAVAIFSRSGKLAYYQRALPSHLQHRVRGLCEKELARILWNSNFSMKTAGVIANTIRLLHSNSSDLSNSWATPIGCIVP
jgi:hypothetical protein